MGDAEEVEKLLDFIDELQWLVRYPDIFTMAVDQISKSITETFEAL